MDRAPIATLTRPQFSQSPVNRVLGDLARDGIADVMIVRRHITGSTGSTSRLRASSPGDDVADAA